MSITYQSEFGELKSILLKHPKSAFLNKNYVETNWQDLNYLANPDLIKANEEYDQFIEIFKNRGIETQFLTENNNTGLDSIYVRDASIVSNDGILICNMGKDQRKYEPQAQLRYYLEQGYQVLGSFQNDATIEGGDVAWINENTIAVARGYRTNDAGIDQLRKYLRNTAEVVVMPSPHFKGPQDVFHLMSVFSPVDKDLAVVYSPLMTVPFREFLIAQRIKLVEVPDNEFDSLGCNVLAIAPRVCVIVKGNPITKVRLEEAGAEVIEFDGNEICLKGSGGPTCLTRPLQREI